MWVPNNNILFNANREPMLFNETLDISNMDNTENNTLEHNSVNASNENEATIGEKYRNVWTEKETMAHIAAVEEKYDDIHHIHKKKSFWSTISEQLNTQNIFASNLLRGSLITNIYQERNLIYNKN